MLGKESSNLPVEDILSSRGRVKVLKVLALTGELNISEICRQAGLNHSSTRVHLSILIRSGLVEEKIFGRIKIYRYRIEDMRARAFRNFLDLWENSPSLMQH